MKTQYILYATGSLLLAAIPALAGSRSGGSGTGAITIPADALNGGGGKSTAGSGAGAVTVTASIGGIGGTVSAGNISNKQGYIPQIMLTGYALWASTNIPAGKDAAFDGDWNGDGIKNGVAYVFGNTAVVTTGKGRIPVPPATPADVTINLDYSGALTSWQNIARWTSGGAGQLLVGGLSFVGGEVRETNPAPRGYFRYRVTRN